MGFNKYKKKKLADLLAKRRAATSATPAPQPIDPAPAVDGQRGVVAFETDDEDTCTGLVFKRQRVGEAVAPSASASGGTPTFMDHPPSASSHSNLLFTRVEERAPPRARRCLLPPSFPCCSNEYSTASRTRRWWRA